MFLMRNQGEDICCARTSLQAAGRALLCGGPIRCARLSILFYFCSRRFHLCSSGGPGVEPDGQQQPGRAGWANQPGRRWRGGGGAGRQQRAVIRWVLFKLGGSRRMAVVEGALAGVGRQQAWPWRRCGVVVGQWSGKAGSRRGRGKGPAARGRRALRWGMPNRRRRRWGRR